MRKNSNDMEQPKKRASRWRFADMFAFLALSASAILLVIGPILRAALSSTDSGVRVMGIVETVAKYCMLAAIALPAWYFVRGKRRGWVIFYFIVLIVYIAGTILGVTLGI